MSDFEGGVSFEEIIGFKGVVEEPKTINGETFPRIITESPKIKVIRPPDVANRFFNKGMPTKHAEEVLRQVLSGVRKHLSLEQISGVFLVGSYIRGRETQESDVDVLILAKDIDLPKWHNKSISINQAVNSHLPPKDVRFFFKTEVESPRQQRIKANIIDCFVRSDIPEKGFDLINKRWIRKRRASF